MERTSTASTKFALALLAAIFVFQVYRAATADITPAEAWNYDRYIGVSWQDSLRQYDTNNHILNTFLARISTSLLGKTEIALRMPSLLCGLLYFAAVWRLLRRLFQGWAFTPALALMVLNPLVLDALSAARGYGMAMAFYLWALELLIEHWEQPEPATLHRVAICLALSVGACLSFIVPVVGLLLAFAWKVRRPIARDLLLPLLVILFVLVAIPLNRMLLSDLATGATSLRQTLAELTAPSFSALPLSPSLRDRIVRIAAGLLILAGFAVSVRLRKHQPILILMSGTAVAGFLFLVAAHAWIKAPFPQTGAVYLVPILSLLLLALLQPMPRLAGAVALGCVAIYIASFPGRNYLEGREFSGSREIAKTLRKEAMQRPARVAASLELEPIFNYYRTRYRQGNWQRLERKAPAAGYDYYLLNGPDTALVDALHLRTISRTPTIVLAAR